MTKSFDVVIVGGGLTGITAATTLRDKGVTDILLLEKESVIGGRVTTFHREQARWDSGAQFFTVRSPLFQSAVASWLEQGWIKKWFGDRYPRYAGVAGMDQLMKALARPLPIQLNAAVKRIEQTKQGWRCVLHTGESIASKAVLLTPPAPISFQLLQKGNIPIDNALRTKI
ncbi:hypothetical protein BEP19_09045 [Ammoniphilus oxalaticus]|uniref:Amine oxidase domain-containing protein n=1 Tax=Ammoniphilus oxalaticus TaxID=66863 RepID=A0A419SKP7_9BACL|nr:FAD-dependent oxidoreductase [Ammoniphilus oxalaticus]RKD24520.1 hypothetical protein BEP19_09045 [Ammoniphilus oxalaticus]